MIEQTIAILLDKNNLEKNIIIIAIKTEAREPTTIVFITNSPYVIKYGNNGDNPNWILTSFPAEP